MSASVDNLGYYDNNTIETTLRFLISNLTSNPRLVSNELFHPESFEEVIPPAPIDRIVTPFADNTTDRSGIVFGL